MVADRIQNMIDKIKLNHIPTLSLSRAIDPYNKYFHCLSRKW